MSEPKNDYEDKVHGAISELISAESALNMEPKPLPLPPKDATFLSETDYWVKHAMDHIHQAISLLIDYRKEVTK